MAGHFKNMALVSLATLGSRVLGLVRDVLSAAFFGAGVFNTAFNFAFTLPNMFRRMLGEGALTSALIPVLNGVLERDREKAAFSFLNRVVTRTFLTLLVLTGIMCALMGVGLWIVDVFQSNSGGADIAGGASQRWDLGFTYAIVLMPYMILVCLAAVQAAALNVLRRFAIAGLSQVWLNLSMIASLGVCGWLLADTAQGRMNWMCAGVLFGGILQVGIPGVYLWKLGWRPKFDLRCCEAISEVQRLILPGLIGACILQINVVVSRFLAMCVDDSAVTLLYYSSRLVELPLGLFTVAAVTVLFPSLSGFAARGDRDGFVAEYARGLRLIWAVAVPAAIGLIVLREPVIDLLFRWGHFDVKDVSLLAPVIAVSALCMPFYSLSTFATRGLHAFKDMRTPMKIALWAFLANLVASLVLMKPLGAVGLAGANLFSAALQSFLLQRSLAGSGCDFSKARFKGAFVHIATAAAVMAGVAWICWRGIVSWVGFGKLADSMAVCLVIPCAIAVYFWVLCACGFEDSALLKDFCARFLGRAKR